MMYKQDCGSFEKLFQIHDPRPWCKMYCSIHYQDGHLSPGALPLCLSASSRRAKVRTTPTPTFWSTSCNKDTLITTSHVFSQCRCSTPPHERQAVFWIYMTSSSEAWKHFCWDTFMDLFTCDLTHCLHHSITVTRLESSQLGRDNLAYT